MRPSSRCNDHEMSYLIRASSVSARLFLSVVGTATDYLSSMYNNASAGILYQINSAGVCSVQLVNSSNQSPVLNYNYGSFANLFFNPPPTLTLMSDPSEIDYANGVPVTRFNTSQMKLNGATFERVISFAHPSWLFPFRNVIQPPVAIVDIIVPPGGSQYSVVTNITQYSAATPATGVFAPLLNASLGSYTPTIIGACSQYLVVKFIPSARSAVSSSSTAASGAAATDDSGLSSSAKIAIGLIIGLFLPLGICIGCCWYRRRNKGVERRHQRITGMMTLDDDHETGEAATNAYPPAVNGDGRFEFSPSHTYSKNDTSMAAGAARSLSRQGGQREHSVSRGFEAESNQHINGQPSSTNEWGFDGTGDEEYKMDDVALNLSPAPKAEKKKKKKKKASQPSSPRGVEMS